MTVTVFSPDEAHALKLTAELAAVIQRVVGPDPETRADDINELYQALHVIQRAIQASALARIAPHEVRGLGQPPVTLKQAIYRCDLCGQPSGTLHTFDCSHVGLLVGDG